MHYLEIQELFQGLLSQLKDFSRQAVKFKGFSRQAVKFKGFSRQAVKFKDFSRQAVKFKGFSILYEPCMHAALLTYFLKPFQD